MGVCGRWPTPSVDINTTLCNSDLELINSELLLSCDADPRKKKKQKNTSPALFECPPAKEVTSSYSGLYAVHATCLCLQQIPVYDCCLTTMNTFSNTRFSENVAHLLVFFISNIVWEDSNHKMTSTCSLQPRMSTSTALFMPNVADKMEKNVHS